LSFFLAVYWKKQTEREKVDNKLKDQGKRRMNFYISIDKTFAKSIEEKAV